jgi:glyoxylase-like metal-dependent hydrolase (beta-lactamase superfamily II)
VRIGEIELTPLSDGDCRLTPGWYVGFDRERHASLLADDGKVHIPIGCYLVRTGDRLVLLDAGLGPTSLDWADGGLLPAALAAVGVEPGDIDTVVCTHLHLDHTGWLVHEERPFFPNATVWFGSGDWGHFVDDADAYHQGVAESMRLLRDEDRLSPIEGDMVPLAPGITARHTPGHTPGSYSLVLSSGTDRAVLLGDAVECPLQIEEPDFHIISDVDPDLAKRTRELLWRELEGTDTLVGAAHFPGLEFGRVLSGGQGRRWLG